jgi:hypothetical protein
MLNLVQISERLKGMPLQAVMQYANGTNPEVPPYIALGELQRRKKMEQEAKQSAAMQQNPQQQPTVKQGIEQTFRPPAPPPQMQGVASLPAPNMEQGFANGGIVAFEDGGRVERYQGLTDGSLVGGAPRMNISGRPPEDRSLFGESLISSSSKDERDILREIEQKIAEGSATPSEIRRANGIRARLLGNVPPPPKAPAANIPSYTQDISGPDFTFRNRPAPPSAAAPSPQRAPGRQSAQPALPTGPNIPVTSPDALIQNQMLEANAAPGTDLLAQFSPASYQQRTLKDIVQGRRKELEDLGFKGLGGEEEQKRLKEIQEKYDKQREAGGLGALADALTAYGSAPRKKALGAAAQALSKNVATQRAEDRAHALAMNQMQSAIERAQRAEAIELIKGSSAELEKEKELASNERREAVRLGMQDKWQTMDDATRQAISKASLDVQERIAKIPPSEFRTLQMIANSTGKSITDILQMKRGAGAAGGLDEDTLVREYNKAKKEHMEDRKTRDKPFPDYASWKKQYVGGATGASGQRVLDFGKI